MFPNDPNDPQWLFSIYSRTLSYFHTPLMPWNRVQRVSTTSVGLRDSSILGKIPRALDNFKAGIRGHEGQKNRLTVTPVIYQFFFHNMRVGLGSKIRDPENIWPYHTFHLPVLMNQKTINNNFGWRKRCRKPIIYVIHREWNTWKKQWRKS